MKIRGWERRKRIRNGSAIRQVERLESRQLLTTITEYNGLADDTPRPTDITTGPDGNLWFAEQNGNEIGRITTSGTITEFPLPANSEPNYITAGPDGNLWFSAPGTNAIGRITTSGSVTEFLVPTSNSGPSGITVGPDGNLWFAEQGGNQIGRITTSGVITEFASEGMNSPYEIVAGPDGNLWFTEINNDAIGKIVPSGVDAGTVTLYPTSAGAGPRGITVGSDGNLWFTEGGLDQIGKITTAGVISEYPGPADGSDPSEIVAGPNGNLFFAEQGVGAIGQITTGGVVTVETPTPTSESAPDGMTVGPDGNVWFTEYIGDQIASLSLAGSALTVSDASGTYGGTATIQANLHTEESEIPDESIDFHLGAIDLGTATTDASGTATIPAASLAMIPAGIYAGKVTATFAGDSNYASSNGSATLDVESAPLVVSVESASKVYGQPIPTLIEFYSGFVNGDTPASLTTPASIATTANLASHVGSYPIAASGASSPNYAITYQPGTLTVTPATLTVTPDDVVKAFGVAVPTLTASYSGFVNGDTAASLTSPVTLSTTATADSDFGSYAITASGGSSPDYTIVGGQGTLTVPTDPLQAGFVESVYQAILGRAPETYGLDSWQAAMNNGMTQATVIDLIYNSSEAIALRAGSGTMANPEVPAQIALIEALYEDVLGRTPEVSGLDGWLARMNAGEDAAQVALGIENSTEAVADRTDPPTPTAAVKFALVDALYLNILGRNPETSGLDGWLTMLGDGDDAAQVAADIEGSPEADAHRSVV